MNRTAAIAVAGIIAASAVAMPAHAATNRVCASNYGNAVYYDTDYSNGYSWHRLSKGACRTNDSNDAYKTSGKSMALVTGLYGVKCSNVSIIRIGTGSDTNIQGYPKTGCKN